MVVGVNEEMQRVGIYLPGALAGWLFSSLSAWAATVTGTLAPGAFTSAGYYGKQKRKQKSLVVWPILLLKFYALLATLCLMFRKFS